MHPRTVLLTLTLIATAAAAQSPADQPVLDTVHAMFDGMAHRDPAAIKATWIPGGTLVLMRDGKPSQMTIEAFADRIGPGKSRDRRAHSRSARQDRQ